MSFVSPIDIAAKRSRVDVMASRPLSAALLVVALITALRLTGTVDSDVAWQLWIAGRMHDGADLYRDIIETNPPLWFWMAVPVERAAALLHVSIESALIIVMSAIGALSLAATSGFIRHLTASRQTMFLCVAALMLCGMPWMHVGQREQLVLIGALPYSALVAARREQRAVPTLLAFAIGAGAGLGFALKHYFLIIPALLELWLVVGLRKRWRPIRAETVAIAMVGVVYAAAIVSFERDFLTRIVPLLQLAYGAYGTAAAPGFGHLFGPFAIVAFVLLGVVALHARHLAGNCNTTFASALAVAAAGFAIAYLIQSKGWPYHAIPVIGCAGLALVAQLLEPQASLRLLRLAAPALLGLPLLLAAQEHRHPALPNADLSAAVASLRPGDPVGFVTTETAVPWSVTLQGKYRYVSRYNGFWMLPAIVRNEALGSPDPRLTALGRRVVAETVHDFTCSPPRRIILSRPHPGESGFDILPFFQRDPRFVELLSHYRVVSRTTFETYELSDPAWTGRRSASPTVGCDPIINQTEDTGKAGSI